MTPQSRNVCTVACAVALQAGQAAGAVDCDMSQCYYGSGKLFKPDMEILGVPMRASWEISAEACQSRCAKTTDCQTFTFETNPSKLPDFAGLCRLQDHNAWGAKTSLPIVSGPKEFNKCCSEVPTLVNAMVTFGAPAISFPAASMPANKCIHGVRIFTENSRLPGGGYGKQVDAASMWTRYPHARTDALILRNSNQSISSYYDCYERPRSIDQIPERMPLWPAAAYYHDWALHSVDNMYKPRLANITLPNRSGIWQETLDRYAEIGVKLAGLADATYLESLEGSLQAVHENAPGWKLVGYALVKGSGSDADEVLLLQSLDHGGCSIAFEGSAGLNDLGAFGSDYGTGFCGFPDTHVGVRNELWHITSAQSYHIGVKPMLPKCKTVTCVGHSLGGALCELFTLCANSYRRGDPDFDQLAWETRQFEQMPELTPADQVVNTALWSDGRQHQPALGVSALASPLSAPPIICALAAMALSALMLFGFFMRRRGRVGSCAEESGVQTDSSDAVSLDLEG